METKVNEVLDFYKERLSYIEVSIKIMKDSLINGARKRPLTNQECEQLNILEAKRHCLTMFIEDLNYIKGEEK